MQPIIHFRPERVMAVWPTEIRLSADKRSLAVSFEDGKAFSIPAELLRVNSPSAEVQGHAPSQRVTVAGKKDVKIAAVEPVGSYAVRLVFDDGHDSGLFTWTILYETGRDKEALFSAYLAELDAKGLSR
jgi:DUF971 family protein